LSFTGLQRTGSQRRQVVVLNESGGTTSIEIRLPKETRSIVRDVNLNPLPRLNAMPPCTINAAELMYFSDGGLAFLYQGIHGLLVGG
jgi:hypothetical protein